MEAAMERDKAYEEYLDAKKAYEDWRDGYMPYFEDKDYFESELERLMMEMDSAEDWYRMTCLEYDNILNDRYHKGIYAEINGHPYPAGRTIKELHQRALELKHDYDGLADGTIAFMGSNSELKSELERRREAWMLAFEDYSDALDKEILRQARQQKAD